MASLDELFLETETSDKFIQSLMKSLVLAVQASNEIPTGTDFSYFSTYREFANLSRNNNEVVVELIEEIIRYVRPGQRIDMFDDFDESGLYDQVIDTIEVLLANADKSMAHLSDCRSNDDIVMSSLLTDKNRLRQSSDRDIVKPQLAFLTEIDNSRERPFRPRLRSKPFAQTPLDLTGATLIVDSLDGDVIAPTTYFPHPYENELRKLRYPSWQMSDPSASQPWMPSPHQPFLFAETEDDLQKVLDEICDAKEISVDLENHSYHSFQGLTCLMQISSRHKDYVIDVLALRSHMHLLGSILANPAIVKVFHGCEHDIIWLQRDFGLYVVNCFDTYHAAKALKYPALSLSHIVKYHCGITLNKTHQLSDWRLRPLPEDMIQYARYDTHYLLYVYDRLRIDLWRTLGKEAVEAVLDASRKVCLKRYEKPFFVPSGYRSVLMASKSRANKPIIDTLSAAQDACLALLWDWRDRTAREMDESTDAVMSNAELLRIGVAMPTSAPQLEACAPLSRIVREKTGDIVSLLFQGLSTGPSLTASFSDRSSSSSICSLKSQRDSNSNPAATPTRAVGKNSSSSGGSLAVRDIRDMQAPFLHSIGSYAVSDNTICTFTPAMMQPSAATSPTEPHEPSPVMRPDEIFRLAGWSTPHDVDLGNRLPILEDAAHVNGGEEGIHRLAKAQHEIIELSRRSTFARSNDSSGFHPENQDIQDYRSRHNSSKTTESLLSRNIDPVAAAIDDDESEHINDRRARTSVTSILTVGDGENVVLVEVPSSFEEIYEISNRNRKRQKDKEKKRGRDGEGVDDDDNDSGETMSKPPLSSVSQSAGALSRSALASSIDAIFQQSDEVMGASVFDESVYFAAASMEHVPDMGIDSTLSFGESLGWLKTAEDCFRIKELHAAEQEQELDQSCNTHGSGQGSQGHNGIHHNDGAGSGRAGGAGGAAISLPKGGGFDYGRVSSGAGAAIGALNQSRPQSGNTQRSSSTSQAPYNPYMGGGGRGQTGGAGYRGVGEGAGGSRQRGK